MERTGSRLNNIVWSFLAGQALFLWLGYDQWGLFMRPKRQFGFGRQLATRVQKRLPATPTAAWAIKVVEILADAAKMPIEGGLFRRVGVVPDGLAAIITQPLFSGLETAEKIAGAALHPERVTEPEQVRVSLGCIYGSLFRFALAAGIWLAAEAQLDKPKARSH